MGHHEGSREAVTPHTSDGLLSSALRRDFQSFLPPLGSLSAIVS